MDKREAQWAQKLDFVDSINRKLMIYMRGGGRKDYEADIGWDKNQKFPRANSGYPANLSAPFQPAWRFLFVVSIFSSNCNLTMKTTYMRSFDHMSLFIDK
jgi:hypothetical protein